MDGAAVCVSAGVILSALAILDKLWRAQLWYLTDSSWPSCACRAGGPAAKPASVDAFRKKFHCVKNAGYGTKIFSRKKKGRRLDDALG